MNEQIEVWIRNAFTFHHRIFARFLERRGWVVFYLPEDIRNCNNVCWLQLYESERK